MLHAVDFHCVLDEFAAWLHGLEKQAAANHSAEHNPGPATDSEVP